METNLLFLILGLLVVGCVLSSKLSNRFNMPCLIIFLGIGMLTRLLYVMMNNMPQGDEHLAEIIEYGGIPWELANGIGTVALAYILFSGGFDTSIKSIRSVWKTSTLLSSVGVLLTALLLGLFAFFLINGIMGLKLHLRWCLLLGAVISSTDAAAVFSILRSKSVSLKGNLQSILEVESGSNDPMAAFLTIFLLTAFADDSSSIGWCLLKIVPAFIWKMAVGLGVGYALGKLAVKIINSINLDYDGLYYVLSMGVVLVTYSGAQCLWGNGYMAVYAAGVVMGSKRFVFKNGLDRFSAAVSWLMQVLLFTMLGFQANPTYVYKFGGCGFIMGLFLMLIARPVACFLCTFRDKSLDNKARTLISWVGLRGGAPILLATFPMLTRTDAIELGGVSIPVNYMLFHVIFVMVLLSVVLQGMTIMPLARFFHLDAPLESIPTSPISFDLTTGNALKGKEQSPQGDNGETDFSTASTKNYTIGAGSDFEGKSIAEMGLPSNVFVLTVRRGQKYIVPKGPTILHANDCLTILGNPMALKETELLFNTTNVNS